MGKAFLSLLLLVFSVSWSLAQRGDTIRTITGLKYVRKVNGLGEKPKKGDKVLVHYAGRLTDGTEFDSSIGGGNPFSFRLGKGKVIPGWEEAIPMMRRGEKGVLIIPPHMGYGDKGYGFMSKANTYIVPPNSTLIFDIELLDFK